MLLISSYILCIPPLIFLKPQFVFSRICVDIYRKTYELTIKEEMSEEWLKTCVLPKIIKWSNSACSATVVPSLSLISAKSYSIKYNYLKEKYAKKFIEVSVFFILLFSLL